MKKTLAGLLMAASVLIAPLGAFADRWDHHNWDTWARNHRDVAVEIQTHPEWLRDQNYLRRHHDLQVYVQSDPGLVNYYTTNPYPVIEVNHHNGAHWHRYGDHHWGY